MPFTSYLDEPNSNIHVTAVDGKMHESEFSSADFQKIWLHLGLCLDGNPSTDITV